MKRYGVMGGTFNPIHMAHLYIAYEAKEKLSLDKVIFMPTGVPPHKLNSDILDSKERYNMVKLAIKDYEGFEISEYEIEKQGLSYTYDTLKWINEENVQVYFITGADCLLNIEKWKNPEGIFKLCTLVVFNRGGYNQSDVEKQKKYIEGKYNTTIISLDIANIEISSSEIRERINKDKRVDFFIPSSVNQYIKANGLYKE